MGIEFRVTAAKSQPRPGVLRGAARRPARRGGLTAMPTPRTTAGRPTGPQLRGTGRHRSRQLSARRRALQKQREIPATENVRTVTDPNSCGSAGSVF